MRVDGDESREILTSLAKLYAGGASVDWRTFDHGRRRSRVALPSYPFDRRRFWLTARPRAQALQSEPWREWLYDIEWRPTDAPPVAEPDGRRWLIFADSCGVGEDVAASIRARAGAATIVVPGPAFSSTGDRFTVNPHTRGDFERVLDATLGDAKECAGIVHCWSIELGDVGKTEAGEREAAAETGAAVCSGCSRH